MTWRETAERMRADHARLVEYLSRVRGEPVRRAWLHPAHVCVWLHRMSHHNYRNGRRWIARLIWHLNTLLTGADIAELSDLGPGLLIPSPVGVALMGRAGRNLTVLPCAGLGGEMGVSRDIGGGPGLPVVGDDVTIGPHSGVLGPVCVGDRVMLEACTGCVRDVASDHVVASPALRVFQRDAGHAAGTGAAGETP